MATPRGLLDEPDPQHPFVCEDREKEVDVKVEGSGIKRGLFRALLQRKRPHRETFGAQPKKARRDNDWGEVDDTFFISEEEAAQRRLNVKAQIGGQLTRRMRTAIKVHHHHSHASSMSHLAEETDDDSPTANGRPAFERQESHISLATLADDAASVDDAVSINTAEADSPTLSRQLSIDDHDDHARIRRSKTMRAKALLRKRWAQKLADSQRPDLTDEERDAALIAALATTHIGFSAEEQLCETDEIWENQRGFVLAGKARFSAQTRLLGDPPTWTQGNHRPSPYTKASMPLPDMRWEWSTNWLIDMRGPVDQHGWSYCWRYSMHGWHAFPSWRNSFVRRRRWVRERRLAGALSAASAQDPSVPLKHSLSPDAGLTEHESPHRDEVTGSDTPRTVPAEISAGPITTENTMLHGISIERALDLLGWEKVVPSRWPFTSLAHVVKEAHMVDRSTATHQSTSDEANLGESWRHSVVECNFRRIERLLGGCALDRKRLECWQGWLEGPPSGTHGDVQDCWDVLEAKLEKVLSMFEYQDARLAFLRMLVAPQQSETKAPHFARPSVATKSQKALTADDQSLVHLSMHLVEVQALVTGDVEAASSHSPPLATPYHDAPSTPFW